MHWLDHPDLRVAELRLAPDLSVIVGTHTPPLENAPGKDSTSTVVRRAV